MEGRLREVVAADPTSSRWFQGSSIPRATDLAPLGTGIGLLAGRDKYDDPDSTKPYFKAWVAYKPTGKHYWESYYKGPLNF